MSKRLGDIWYVELTGYMPSKKPSLYGRAFSEPPKEKKPTLLQYLKSTKNVTFPFYSRINIVWLPGSFSNFTLECENFRISVSSSNALYGLLNGSGWGEFLSTETAILVSVLDSKGTIELAESNAYGRYEPIGNLGIKFIPTEGAN